MIEYITNSFSSRRMAKTKLKFNTALEVLEHLEQNELTSEEFAYYSQRLRANGIEFNHNVNKEK
jgi:hypothetical protein